MAGPIRSRFVMAGRVRTHYSEIGDNAPVLVGLHGGGAGSSGEAGLGRIMPALGDRLRVVALDSVGGYGLTDPSAPVPYGIQSRVDHLEDFVDALCLDKFSLIGNSQGAWAAARYAILHPDRVEKLVLVASSTIATAMGLPAQQTDGLRALMSYDGTREAMRRVLEALIADKSKITDDLIDRRQAAATRPGAQEAAKAFRDGTNRLNTELFATVYDMRNTLPRITQFIPTIFIWGENDTFAPVTMGRALQPMLPPVKFHFVDKAGHQAQNDQPELVARLVLDFLTAKTPAKI